MNTSTRHRLLLATLLCAARLAPAQTEIHTVPGDWIDYWAGVSVSGPGDVDRDGFADILVGVPGASPSGRLYGGQAVLVSGRTGKRLFQAYGLAAGDNFGHGVGNCGDVDRDGVPDFLVGAPSAFQTGQLFAGYAALYSGRTSQTIHTWKGATGDTLGYASSGGSDYDRDGVPDVILGCSGATVRGMGHAGSVQIHSGRTGALIVRFDGEVGGDMFGGSVADLGDVDADGFNDIGIGGLLTNSGAADSGSTWVYSGRTFGLLHRFDGTTAAEWHGAGVRAAGDVDRDGSADILVGAPGANPNGMNGAGSVFVYSGKTGQVLLRLDGPGPGANFGRGLTSVGDVDHDGCPDILAGAMFANVPGKIHAGQCFLFSGKNGAIMRTWDGPTTGENMGWSVARLGDVNGDGVEDVVFGAPGLVPSPTFMTGAAYVHSTQPLSFWSRNHLLSAGLGGTVPLFLAAPAATAGHASLVLAGASGHAPGVNLGSMHLPLNLDAVTNVALAGLNKVPFASFFGTLDASARGIAVFGAPGPFDPALVGVVLTFAYLTIDPSGSLSFSSRANFVGIDQ